MWGEEKGREEIEEIAKGLPNKTLQAVPKGIQNGGMSLDENYFILLFQKVQSQCGISQQACRLQLQMRDTI